jgi:hypothetical protein
VNLTGALATARGNQVDWVKRSYSSFNPAAILHSNRFLGFHRLMSFRTFLAFEGYLANNGTIIAVSPRIMMKNLIDSSVS